MQITVTHEEGTEQIEGEVGKTVHALLQENGINIQNYIVRHGNTVISSQETLDDAEHIELELIKIVSGG